MDADAEEVFLLTELAATDDIEVPLPLLLENVIAMNEGAAAAVAALPEVEDHARVGNYAEITVNLYSDADFRSHFRMNRSTFEVCTCIMFHEN